LQSDKFDRIVRHALAACSAPKMELDPPTKPQTIVYSEF